MLGNGHVVISEEDIRAVVKTLSSGDVGGGSSYVDEYEAALASFFGVEHAVACSSGTSAISIALQALEAGGEVLVPATAPVMTPLAVLAAGATPVFVDVDPAIPFSPSFASVEERRTDKTSAIMTVPMWGYPGAETEVAEMAARLDLHHLEDAAQAHGATVNGRLLGTIGTVGNFSTHSRKLMTTGEGGFCLTQDRAAAEGMRSFRTFGRDGSGFGSVAGGNAKLAGVLAALGIVQLGRLRERVESRRRIWCDWQEALSGLHGLRVLLPPAGAEANAYALVLRADTPDLRERVEDLLADLGIASDPRRYAYAPPYFRPALSAFARSCPEAERLCSTVCTVPTHEAVPRRLIPEVASRLRSL